MNKIRAVRHTSHADNSMQRQLFQHTADMIDSSATQLLIGAWNTSKEKLSHSYFSGYSTQKLITYYDHLSQTAPAHSSADRLRQLICAGIRSRIDVRGTPRQGLVCCVCSWHLSGLLQLALRCFEAIAHMTERP
jgi:hypothetical protein